MTEETNIAAVERQAAPRSRQPRFSEPDRDQFFTSVYRWAKMAQYQAPTYSASSRTRDAWLRQFWQQEPHLAGVLNSVVAIDKNRAWTLTGGRNQVLRYQSILHNYNPDEDGIGIGWRPGISQASLSFYTADINTVVEIGRDGRGGPLRALWNVDPAMCQLTGDGLKFYPRRGKVQEWTYDDFFRVASMPSTDERFYNLGFCAVSRALELAQIMIAVYEHDQEQLGARAPEGLLLLHGVGQPEWERAMEAREEALDDRERRWYGGVAVLASSGMDQLDAKLVALSQLPADFDHYKAVDYLMYGYALAFGYDASEFFPVQFGSLGRGTETEAQHRKATGKGGQDFALGFQEQLTHQRHWPPTLHFEFDQRDAEGDLQEAEVAQAWADVAATLAGSKTGGLPLVPTEFIPSYLVERGIWPEEWTVVAEDSIATDTEAERFLDTAAVRRAMEEFPGESIWQYRWDPFRPATVRVLWDGVARRYWYDRRQKRRQEAEPDEILYQDPDGEFSITRRDVENAITEGARRVGPEFAELLLAPTMTAEEIAEAEDAD